ncbi:hypothetical protein [Lacticaseibacillus pantheris]|jgi:hypothetical protein
MRKRISASKQREYQRRHELAPSEQLKWDRKQAAKKTADAYRKRREQLRKRHERDHALMAAVHTIEDKYGSIQQAPAGSPEVTAVRLIVDAQPAPAKPVVTREMAMYYRTYKAIGDQKRATKALGIGIQTLRNAIVAVEENGGLGK